jgi:hypothetical protein
MIGFTECKLPMQTFDWNITLRFLAWPSGRLYPAPFQCCRWSNNNNRGFSGFLKVTMKKAREGLFSVYGTRSVPIEVDRVTRIALASSKGIPRDRDHPAH